MLRNGTRPLVRLSSTSEWPSSSSSSLPFVYYRPSILCPTPSPMSTYVKLCPEATTSKQPLSLTYGYTHTKTSLTRDYLSFYSPIRDKRGLVSYRFDHRPPSAPFPSKMHLFWIGLKHCIDNLIPWIILPSLSNDFLNDPCYPSYLTAYKIVSLAILSLYSLRPIPTSPSFEFDSLLT